MENHISLAKFGMNIFEDNVTSWLRVILFQVDISLTTWVFLVAERM